MKAFVRHGREVVEIAGAVRVGRSSHCEIVLADDVASREHCRIEREGDRIFLVDLESRNGVKVNGRRVEGRRELHHGDVVTIGLAQLVLLRRNDAPSAQPGSEARTRDGAPAAAEHAALGEFVRAARRELARGAVPSAGANARSLLRALPDARASDPQLLEEVGSLLLELAERAADPYWLDRLIELHLRGREPLTLALAEAIVRESARLGPPGAVLEDYLAAATHMPGHSDEVAARLRSLIR